MEASRGRKVGMGMQGPFESLLCEGQAVQALHIWHVIHPLPGPNGTRTPAPAVVVRIEV